MGSTCQYSRLVFCSTAKLTVWHSSNTGKGRGTYHGTPRSNRSCVWMKMAKTPMMLPEVSNMVKIHKFSENGGQL